jgi:hypothetical protein
MDFIKYAKLLEHVSDYKLFIKDFAPWMQYFYILRLFCNFAQTTVIVKPVSHVNGKAPQLFMVEMVS